MSLFNLLSEEDKDKIWGYINKYGGEDAHPMTPDVDLEYLLRFWNENKTYLCKVFGNKLILEKDIDIECPETILMEGMENALWPKGTGISFVNNYLAWTDDFYQRDYSIYLGLQHLLCLEDLVNNVYDSDSFELPVPNQPHPIQINKGCKVMKVLAKIAKAFEIEGFEDFRLKHSMVLNQKRFKGKLCLSIHPLDYMTMSDNDYEWDSCMAWMKPGEYRIGTVEMMNSEWVIVAYLKGADDMILYPGATWDNKKWRELFVINPFLITQIKGYPYNDKILEKEVFNWILELMSENIPEANYDTEPVNIGSYRMQQYNGHPLHLQFRFRLMYDDFGGRHMCYFNPAIINELDSYHNFRLELSGETECMKCGEDCSYDASNFNTEFLICPDCSGQLRCPECGDTHDLYDMIELDDGSYLCRWCAEDYVGTCLCCDKLSHLDYLNPVHLNHMGRCLDDIIYLCDDCLTDSYITRKFGPVELKKRRPEASWSDKVYQVSSANLTDEGFMEFGYYGKYIDEMRQQLAE